jgi:hypothetical protein
LQAVAETSFFTQDADRLLSRSERDAIIEAIARDPAGGDLIPETGGLRKRRLGLGGRGKRGGARVITFYLDDAHPVYVVFLYAKNERENLSPAQTKALARLVADIKQTARARRRK